ncbi:MAG: hypothetical protein OXR64_02665 [Chloroflexota bacterium]|nr:hypothetical protein [Chloroflexota bacterium]MDE2918729.1 hypothetical protein [Chloroflexota bacterium]
MAPNSRRLRCLRPRLLVVAATVAAGLLAGCGESAATPEDSAELTAAMFDRAAYDDAIAGGELAVSARLSSPTNDGDGDVRVEVDRRPSDLTTRLAVSIARESGQVAFAVMEVGDRTYFRQGPADADGEWISTDPNAPGADTPRVESLAGAFPVVGDLAGSVRADGWTERGAEPCPSTGTCFVLTNPAFEFASLYVDADTYRPVHIRLARPGMRAAGEIEIDWIAADPVDPPANARPVNAGEYSAALGPVLQAIGL